MVNLYSKICNMPVKQLEGKISKHFTVIISGLWHYRDSYYSIYAFLLFSKIFIMNVLFSQLKKVLFDSLINNFFPLSLVKDHSYDRIPISEGTTKRSSLWIFFNLLMDNCNSCLIVLLASSIDCAIPFSTQVATKISFL